MMITIDLQVRVLHAIYLLSKFMMKFSKKLCLPYIACIQLLKRSLKECLKQTSQFKMKSIAFPVDGMNQCPIEDLSEAVMKVAVPHPNVQVRIRVALLERNLHETVCKQTIYIICLIYNCLNSSMRCTLVYKYQLTIKKQYNTVFSKLP